MVALIVSWLHPRRILAVTGNGSTALTTAKATRSRSGQSLRSADPPCLQTTLLTGHPKFRSMKSGSTQSRTAFAASAIRCGSAPNNWTPTGRSSARKVQHLSRVLVAVQYAIRGDKFGHQHVRALLLAKPAKNRVRNSRHRREVKRTRVVKPRKHRRGSTLPAFEARANRVHGVGVPMKAYRTRKSVGLTQVPAVTRALHRHCSGWRVPDWRCHQRIDFLLHRVELIQPEPWIHDYKDLASLGVFVNKYSLLRTFPGIYLLQCFLSLEHDRQNVAGIQMLRQILLQ